MGGRGEQGRGKREILTRKCGGRSHATSTIVQVGGRGKKGKGIGEGKLIILISAKVIQLQILVQVGRGGRKGRR